MRTTCFIAREWPIKKKNHKVDGGLNFFMLDSRRFWAPASKVLGSDIKTHLESRRRCAILILYNM